MATHTNPKTPAPKSHPHPKPTRFGLLLFPEFEVLDVFGPIEALNVLVRLGVPDLSLSIIAATLDPVSSMPAGSLVNQKVVPTHTFADAPPLDVLLVPGGPGTEKETAKGAVKFLREKFGGLGYLITVCTGAAVAARAGVLDGERATSNKNFWKSVSKLGPHTYWVAHARWVVSGKIWTTSGVSAGIDGMVAWVAAVYGEDLAEKTVRRMEYVRNPDPKNDPFTAGDEDVPPVKEY